MKNNLLFLEINEFDLSFVSKGAKKYNFKKIIGFLNKKKKINSFTEDRKEGYNLDPWVQWVSVHTGKSSKNHKIFRIGQTLSNSIKQIWEILAKSGYSSTIWGAFNSTLRNKKNIDLFFPDPWSYKETAYPAEFEVYNKLPSYYAQNYPAVSKYKLIYLGLLFLYKIFFSNIFFYLLKNLFSFFDVFIKCGLKSYNLYFFLDLISLKIIENEVKKNKSDFTLISLNSFAHFQHNYWDEKNSEYYYFWYFNEMVKVFEKIEKNYSSIIIFNGFSQKKINTEYHIRPKKPDDFLKILNLKYEKIVPNMTTGATVYFSNKNDKIKAIKILKQLSIYDYPIFDIHNFKENNKLFFKFSIVTMKENLNINKINKKNYKSLIQKPSRLIYKSTFSNSKLINIIFKNVIYMKSTSRHSREGVLLYKNFLFNRKDFKNGKINNKKIFNNILSHFNQIVVKT